MSLSESLTGDSPEYRERPDPRFLFTTPDTADRLTEALAGIMTIDETLRGNEQYRSAIVFRGNLLADADVLYPVIVERFKAYGYTPMLERQGKIDVLTAVEGVMVARSIASPGWVHALLLVATIVTTTLSGAGFQGYGFSDLIQEVFSRHNPGYIWTLIQAGAPFSLTLLLILGIHEMGHYVAARRHGVNVTLPYFVPLPFVSILGTLGAVIFIKSALTNRKALFDVGISGPLAGFVVAIVAFIVGLQTVPYAHTNTAFYEAFGQLGIFRGLGMPPLLQWLGGMIRPDENLSIVIKQQPIALAAWFGVLLTVLNLLPIGQLDGGHVMYTLFGRFAWVIATIAFAGLIFLGLTVFASFLFYAVLALLTGIRHPPPGNDITPLDLPRKVIGYGTVALFFLIMTVTPFLIQPFTR